MINELMNFWERLRLFLIYIYVPGTWGVISMTSWRRGHCVIALMQGIYTALWILRYPRFLQLIWRSLLGEW